MRQPASTPRKVLIAEDEALIRLELKEMLEEEGYEVVGEAASGPALPSARPRGLATPLSATRPAEVADILYVSPKSVSRWAKEGKLPFLRTPDDASARGDQHPARIGVRQGLQVQLLADAGRCPSVHPADLRLALPGVPHPRPAVLQLRRLAVSGARQWAAGGGAGPAVAGQGDAEGRHRRARSGP